MQRAAVPEAAIHEYGDSGPGESDVYRSASVARNGALDPVPKASRVEGAANG
jgi:hypothetical protein